MTHYSVIAKIKYTTLSLLIGKNIVHKLQK